MFNTAARILTLTPQSDDIETVLLDTVDKLHWLPVPKRIQYKILLLTFKVIHGLAPRYLAELLELQVTERANRHKQTASACDRVMNTRTFGDRALIAAAPTLSSYQQRRGLLIALTLSKNKPRRTYSHLLINDFIPNCLQR